MEQKEENNGIIEVGSIAKGMSGKVYDPSGISPTFTETHGNVAKVLTLERTPQEKERRHREGDRGAKYSAAKTLAPRPDEVSNTLTSAQKDNLLIEPFNDDEGCSRTIKAQYQRNSAANFIRQDGLGATAVIEGEPIRVAQANERGYAECPPGGVFDAAYPGSPTRRGRVQDGGEVTPTICSAQQGLCLYEGVMSHPLSHRHENPQPHTDASPALRATDYKCPQCVIEQTLSPSTERILQVGNADGLEPKIIGYSRDNKGNVVSRHIKDTANTITAVNADAHRPTTAQYLYQPSPDMQKYRIRKLTPRECWRLMDVDDADYDKIDAAVKDNGKPLISKTQRYKLAGNSIVVSCLYHIFRGMFIDPAPDGGDERQLTIFDIPGVE